VLSCHFFALIGLFLASRRGGFGVRGAKLRVIKKRGLRWGISPESRFVFAGIAALGVGFALGLPAASLSLSIFAMIQPDHLASFGSQNQANRQLRVVGLESVFATENRDGQSERTTFSSGRAYSAEDTAIDLRKSSFDERFVGALGRSTSRKTPESEERANKLPLGSPNLGGQAVAAHVVGQSDRDAGAFPTSPPANVSTKQSRIEKALEDSTSPSDADGHTAIYDIAEHTVYLPNGQRLEAHSGLGRRLDDPRYVSEKNLGPTPPNVYNLSLREELFHGVHAIRLNPVDDRNMFGRDGMLAHTYMLGRNGQSNGCVSFRDYPRFLNAFLGGEINRLVVVERLATTPNAQTASGWLPETIKTARRSEGGRS
jgi:hypothetical protein